MQSDKTQVFLSYKYHGEGGTILPDYYMAKDLYGRLTAIGINTFFSDFSVHNSGDSDYKRLIDDNLDSAEVLIVVSSDPKYCNSNWVRYEWDSFYHDILGGRKKGELLSYLDTTDVGSFPRTIRSLQSFKKKDIDSLVDFVSNYFHSKSYTNQTETFTPKGSNYNYDINYELGDEKRRLAIQAKVESGHDFEYINELLGSKDKFYVLDVGCSMGEVTKDVFNPFGERACILGVDKFAKCVNEFNLETPNNMFAEQLNFEDDNWCEQLRAIMDKHNISSFDLIYCSLSLHHMSNSASVVKRLWKFISCNGYIYIRTCDDALKIAYPNEKLIYDIIQRTASVPGASDRFHGRKIHSMLYKGRFKNITMKSFLIDTCNKTLDERYALFYSAFIWRKNYFKVQLDRAKSSEEIRIAMNEYNKTMEMLDQIENLFLDSSFYFGYYVTIAIGQKLDFIL